jgi:glutaredoxin
MVAIRVELFTRRGCHLCDDAKAVLLSLRAERPFELVETDVDANYALQQAYGLLVPVIVVDGRRVSELRVDEAARTALRRCLEGVR